MAKAISNFTITPNIAVLILIIIIGIILAITFFVSPETFHSGRTGTFFACMAGFSIIIIFFFYYMIVVINTKQQKILINQESNLLGNTLPATVYRDMVTTAAVAPQFVAELNPLSIGRNTDVNNIPTQIQKVALAHQIFAGWQLALQYDEFQQDPEPYVALALQRAHSKELEVYWGQMRLDFNSRAQCLGDLFFRYARPIPVGAGPEAYQRAAVQLINSEAFESLF